MSRTGGGGEHSGPHRQGHSNDRDGHLTFVGLDGGAHTASVPRPDSHLGDRPNTSTSTTHNRSGASRGHGGVTSDASILRLGDPDPISFRSMNEKRVAEEILKKEGSWDEESQVYRTRQRQLQERTRVMSQLGLTLRYSPIQSYRLQSEDLSFVYPNAPAQLLKHHKTPHDKLSEADPTPENVVAKSKEQVAMAHMRRLKGVSTHLSGSSGAVFPSQKEAEEVIQSLEKELRVTAESVISREPSIATTASIRPYRGGGGGSAVAGRGRGGAASGGGRGVGARSNEREDRVRPSSSASYQEPRLASTPSTYDQPRRGEGTLSTPTAGGANDSTGRPLHTPLPTLSLRAESTSGGYSSLLMQLRKTKKEVEQHHKELSTVRSILGMDGSADLKRTITRMFAEADPKNREAISEEEHQRRERLFEEERKRTFSHQTSLLKEEREAMERELAQLQLQ